MRIIIVTLLASLGAFVPVAFAQTASPPPVPASPAEDAEAEPPYPRFEVGARVMTGYRYELEKPEVVQGDVREQSQEFILKQARVGVDAELNDQVSAEISFELKDAISPKLSAADMDQPPYVRDASIDVKFLRELRLRVGRYKRPLSELELTPISKLSVLDRGLLNALLLEDNEWGDRALGAMLWGKVRWAKLEWALSLTNSAWSPAFSREGIDVLGRLQASPVKGLAIGVSGGRKSLKFANSENVGYGVGVDAKYKAGGLFILTEGVLAKQLFETGRPIAFGALLLTSYDLPLSTQLTLQPTLFFEYADAHSEFTQTEAVKNVVGLNLLYERHLRLMPQMALTLPVGEVSEFNPWATTYEYTLLVSLNL